MGLVNDFFKLKTDFQKSEEWNKFTHICNVFGKQSINFSKWTIEQGKMVIDAFSKGWKDVEKMLNPNHKEKDTKLLYDCFKNGFRYSIIQGTKTFEEARDLIDKAIKQQLSVEQKYGIKFEELLTNMPSALKDKYREMEPNVRNIMIYMKSHYKDFDLRNIPSNISKEQADVLASSMGIMMNSDKEKIDILSGEDFKNIDNKSFLPVNEMIEKVGQQLLNNFKDKDYSKIADQMELLERMSYKYNAQRSPYVTQIVNSLEGQIDREDWAKREAIIREEYKEKIKKPMAPTLNTDLASAFMYENIAMQNTLQISAMVERFCEIHPEYANENKEYMVDYVKASTIYPFEQLQKFSKEQIEKISETLGTNTEWDLKSTQKVFSSAEFDLNNRNLNNEKFVFPTGIMDISKDGENYKIEFTTFNDKKIELSVNNLSNMKKEDLMQIHSITTTGNTLEYNNEQYKEQMKREKEREKIKAENEKIKQQINAIKKSSLNKNRFLQNDINKLSKEITKDPVFKGSMVILGKDNSVSILTSRNEILQFVKTEEGLKINDINFNKDEKMTAKTKEVGIQKAEALISAFFDNHSPEYIKEQIAKETKLRDLEKAEKDIEKLNLTDLSSEILDSPEVKRFDKILSQKIPNYSGLAMTNGKVVVTTYDKDTGIPNILFNNSQGQLMTMNKMDSKLSKVLMSNENKNLIDTISQQLNHITSKTRDDMVK